MKRIEHRAGSVSQVGLVHLIPILSPSRIFSSVSVGSSPRLYLLETFRINDENDYEYEI